MKTPALLLLAVLAPCGASAAAAELPLRGQIAGNLGLFEAQCDVGNPALKGSAVFDPAARTYIVTGAGANMWAGRDEFQFVWRKVSGSFTLAATIRFPKPGAMPHRKAGLMVRQSLDAGAPYVDAVVHGSGLTEMQLRDDPGGMTRSIRFPVDGPVRIRLERRSGWFTMHAAAEGRPFQELGAYAMKLADPVYLGLIVCSHKAAVGETAVFSDVGFEALRNAPQKNRE